MANKKKRGRAHLSSVPAAGRRSGRIDRESMVDVAQMIAALAEAGAPPEVLRVIAEAGNDPIALMEALAAVRQMAGEQGAPGSISGSWDVLLQLGSRALDAEMAACEFLALFTRAGDGGDVDEPLAHLVLQPDGGDDRPEVLAMSRVLATLGRPLVRDAARQSAARLALRGVPDMPWAGVVGHPEWRSTFGFDDPSAQRWLAIEFAYGSDSHLLVILIDRQLGGGIKDCWVSNEIKLMRSRTRARANADGVAFLEISAGETANILAAALACPPCPVAEDQIEDVLKYLPLVTSRFAALLDLPSVDRPTPALATAPTPRAARRRTGSSVPDTGEGSIYRLKVSLAGAKPPIWRRLEVPAATTLTQLHETIQEAFAWYGMHLWVFDTPRGAFGEAGSELDFDDAAAVRLSAVAPVVGARFTYTYDFGDDWTHQVTVEAVSRPGSGLAYPRCTGGRRAAPPEDCGGIWAYQDLLKALDDPESPAAGEALEYLGLESVDEFDPADFSAAETDEWLTRRPVG